MVIARSLLYSILLCILLYPCICILCMEGTAQSMQVNDTVRDEFRFNIIATSDLHSMVAGNGPDADLSRARGHFARLAYLIRMVREHLPGGSLAVDSGDWFSGSLFHTLSISYMFNQDKKNLADPAWWFKLPLELDFLTKMQFDATTIGNHEFDPDPIANGFEILLEHARTSNITIPILASNIYVDNITKRSSAKHKKCVDSLNSFIKNETEVASFGYALPKFQSTHYPSRRTGIQPFTLKQMKDKETGAMIKVGIYGVQGIDSSMLSTAFRQCARFIGFDDANGLPAWNVYVAHHYEMVRKLRRDYGADVVILLAHAGEPEDLELVNMLRQYHVQQLAKLASENSSSIAAAASAADTVDAPLIDFHLGGHTHSEYTYLAPDGTVIHQNGPYGENLSVLQVDFNLRTRRCSLRNLDVPMKDYFYVDQLKNPRLPHDFLVQPRIRINANIPFDVYYLDIVHRYVDILDRYFLANQPFKYATPIGAIPSGEFSSQEDFGRWLLRLVEDDLCHQLRLGENTSESSYARTTNRCPLLFSSLPGVRLVLQDLQQWNSSRVQFQFSDIFRAFGTGLVSTYANSHNMPSEPIVLYYVSKGNIEGHVNGDVLYKRFKPIYYAVHSSSLTYKYHKWGIPYINMVSDLQYRGTPWNEMPDMMRVAMPKWISRYVIGTPLLVWLDPYNEFGHKMSKLEAKSQSSQFYEYLSFARSLSKQSVSESFPSSTVHP